MKRRLLPIFLTVSLVLLVGSSVFASPYATDVIGYASGSNPQAGYTNPDVALGAPERVTGETTFGGAYAGDVTVFNSPWETNEIVSIGAGGYLTLGFDHPVMDDASNPYGLDFIVFGNAFFLPDPGNVNDVYAEPASIRVSQDNLTWFDIHFVPADALFPTQGYMDTTDPFGSDPGGLGSLETDFQKPVDPSIDWQGKSYSEMLALYNGSGGGTGVDIAAAVDAYGNPAGIDSIQYVMFYVPYGDNWSSEIDAVSDVAAVPLPGAFWLLGSGLLAVLGMGRKRG